jgi:hypothetical protein
MKPMDKRLNKEILRTKNLQKCTRFSLTITGVSNLDLDSLLYIFKNVIQTIKDFNKTVGTK